MAPDIYSPDFSFWCSRYTERGNPLFIPETTGYGTSSRNFFYVFGEHNAMGISPFAIDSIPDPGKSELARTYALLDQMAPLISRHQGKQEMIGFILNKEKPSLSREIGGYELEISLDSIFGFNAEEGCGIIIATGPDEFIGAGSGFRVRFKPKTLGPAMAGIGSVDEGSFHDGIWIPGRRLNGDENDQGRFWRFDRNAIRIERCVVYRWE
jgi:hypothetical protein